MGVTATEVIVEGGSAGSSAAAKMKKMLMLSVNKGVNNRNGVVGGTSNQALLGMNGNTKLSEQRDSDMISVGGYTNNTMKPMNLTHAPASFMKQSNSQSFTADRPRSNQANQMATGGKSRSQLHVVGRTTQ